MYSLRMIEPNGLQQNTLLGKEYMYADRFVNGGQAFREKFLNVFGINHVADLDVDANDTTKNCVGFVITDGVTIPVWKTVDTFIMIGGETFTRLTHMEHNN